MSRKDDSKRDTSEIQESAPTSEDTGHRTTNGNSRTPDETKDPENAVPTKKLTTVQMTGTTVDHPLSDETSERRTSQTLEVIDSHAAVQDGPTPEDIDLLPTTRAMVEVERIGSIGTFTMEVEELISTNEAMGSPDIYDQSSSSSQAAVLSVSCFKPTLDTKIGIGFRSVAGELQINNISPHGLLGSSPLKPGDRIVSLDSNQNTAVWTAVQAATYVRTKTGFLSIVIKRRNGDPNRTESVVFKQKAEDKVGVSFYNDDGMVRINYLNPTALLGETSALQLGDYVETINSVDVSFLDAALALDLVRSAVGMVTICAKHNHTAELSIRDLRLSTAFSSSRRLNSEQFLTTADEVGDLESGLRRGTQSPIRPSFMSVKVSKQSQDMRLGIAFMNPTKSKLLVASILDNAILGISPLIPGCIVHSINNVRCQTWTREYTRNLLREKVGDVLFMAQDPNGSPSYSSALAYKPTPRSPIGISFKSSGGPLKVGNIRSEGIFGDSILNVDDEIISINNIPCSHMSPTEAVRIVQQNADIVWLVAKSGRRNGIVLSHGSGIAGGDEYERAVPASMVSSGITQQNVGDRKAQRACFTIIGAISFALVLVIISGAN